jgi:hypothetical protein
LCSPIIHLPSPQPPIIHLPIIHLPIIISLRYNLTSNMPDSGLAPETEEDDIWGMSASQHLPPQSIIAIRQFDHPIVRPYQ